MHLKRRRTWLQAIHNTTFSQHLLLVRRQTAARKHILYLIEQAVLHIMYYNSSFVVHTFHRDIDLVHVAPL